VPRPFPKKISQIKPTLTNLAQTSHYLIEFGGFGSSLREHLRLRGMDSRYIAETIGLLCSRASLPGSGFATTDVVGNFMGVSEKFAHTRTFVQMDLDFYVDNSYKSLKFLEHWMEFISSGSTTDAAGDRVSPLRDGYYFRMRYPSEYKCNETRIIKFERNYQRYIEYRFYGLFPISLNSTTVSYEGSNILKATASFSYERYISGKSYSYDVYRNQENNKEQIGSLKEQPPTTSNTLDNGISSPGNSSSDRYKFLTNFNSTSILSPSSRTGFDLTRDFGVLNNTAYSDAFIGERIL
jgi:hypothetical protein